MSIYRKLNSALNKKTKESSVDIRELLCVPIFYNKNNCICSRKLAQISGTHND